MMCPNTVVTQKGRRNNWKPAAGECAKEEQWQTEGKWSSVNGPLVNGEGLCGRWEDGSEEALCHSEQRLQTSVDVEDYELIVQWRFISMWALNMHEHGAQWEKNKLAFFICLPWLWGMFQNCWRKLIVFFFLSSNLSHFHFLQLHCARGFCPLHPVMFSV